MTNKKFSYSTRRAVSLSADGSTPIDPVGGQWGAGLIRNVIVMSRGESKGWDLWVDEVTIQQVNDYINQQDGVKCRLGHPSMMDGLFDRVGIIKDARIVGDSVVADLHVQPASGDKGQYILSLALDDLETGKSTFGLSITGFLDLEAEQPEPEPDNVNQYPCVRLESVTSVDVVDDPAATRRFILSTSDVEVFFAQCLGIGSEDRELVAFGQPLSEIKTVFQNVLTKHGLRLSAIQENNMEDTTVQSETIEQVEVVSDSQTAVIEAAKETKEEPKEEPKEGNLKGFSTPTEEAVETTETVVVETAPVVDVQAEVAKAIEQDRQRLSDLISAYGQEFGLSAFNQGLTVETAKFSWMELQIAELKKENEALKQNSKYNPPVKYGEKKEVTATDYVSFYKSIAKDRNLSVDKAQEVARKERPDLYTLFRSGK